MTQSPSSPPLTSSSRLLLSFPFCGQTLLSLILLSHLLCYNKTIVRMPSNNNDVDSNHLTIKFGPNKTAKHFYLRLLICLLCILLLTVLCTLLLLSFNPAIRDSLRSRFTLVPSPLNSTKAATSELTGTTSTTSASTTTTVATTTQKLSERNDLDPEFQPNLRPDDDLLPSSSTIIAEALPLTSSAASMTHAVADEESRGTSSARSSVFKVTWIQPKPVDRLTGDDVIVKTRVGKVRGIRGDVLGRKVEAFLGIPYTERPPIGDHHFARSVKRTSRWRGTLDARSFRRPHCPQVFDEDVIDKRTILINEISEDCLYLNIWSPGRRDASSFPRDSPLEGGSRSTENMPSSKLRPVMLWIFGGGFSSGSNLLDETDGRMLAALGDVIVVTINYRIGKCRSRACTSDSASRAHVRSLICVSDIIVLQEPLDSLTWESMRHQAMRVSMTC